MKLNKQLKKMIFLLALLLVLALCALVGTSVAGSIIGGETIKESRVPDCDNDARCTDTSRLVRVGGVESFVPSIFDLPAVPTEQLAYLRDVTMYIDMTDAPDIGGPVEATFKLAGAYKRSSTAAYLVTTNGLTIALDAVARSGNITMDGAVYAISESVPESSGRQLDITSSASVGADTLTAKQLAEHHESRRRQLGFSGALMTSGSFTMMASSGF